MDARKYSGVVYCSAKFKNTPFQKHFEETNNIIEEMSILNTHLCEIEIAWLAVIVQSLIQGALFAIIY